MSSLWSLTQAMLPGRQGPRLHPLTVQLHPGCTAVIGYSGAGKTSLLNLLVGFEKPGAGTVVHPATPVFWAPQDNGLWPHLTVREHFSVVRPGALPDDLLRDFDLAHKLARRPDELSEGEQSRLGVARALWSHAPVLVMDEPLVHVDPARAETCWRVIRRHLSRDRGFPGLLHALARDRARHGHTRAVPQGRPPALRRRRGRPVPPPARRRTRRLPGTRQLVRAGRGPGLARPRPPTPRAAGGPSRSASRRPPPARWSCGPRGFWVRSRRRNWRTNPRAGNAGSTIARPRTPCARASASP